MKKNLTDGEIDAEVQNILRDTSLYAYEAFVEENWGGMDNLKIPTDIIAALGLEGERGEVADAIKKVYRDGYSAEEVRAYHTDSTVLAAHRHEIAKELGDQLFYLVKVAHEFGLDLRFITAANVSKLLHRMQAPLKED